jgi:hypothetical protein
MALKVHEPEIEMGGGQVIRVANEDRPMSWTTFHFESEVDAIAAQKQLSGALSKAIKVEWP